jgi:hypothetical protein
MAYPELDQLYLGRVHDDDTLVGYSSFPCSVVESCGLELPRRLGHNLFLFGNFLSESVISVQPWAVGPHVGYEINGGRHSVAAFEAIETHKEGRYCLSFGHGAKQYGITGEVTEGYYWKDPLTKRIITVIAGTEVLRKGKVGFRERASILARATEPGEILSDHEIHIGRFNTIADGVIEGEFFEP